MLVLSSSLFLSSSPSLCSQPPSSSVWFLSDPSAQHREIAQKSSGERFWAGQAGSLLTGYRFMAQRPTLGPKEGFSGDYRLLPPGPTFSHLIWELTENRGCPSSSRTLLQAFVFWTFACLLSFALRADVSHKPNLVREGSIGTGWG